VVGNSAGDVRVLIAGTVLHVLPADALIETGTVNRILCNRRLVELGGIAYCVYLVHLPFFQAGHNLAAYLPVFSRLSIPYIVQALADRSLAIILMLAVAKLSWHFLERPLLIRGHAFKY
jgi:peptidoglycan/LPS O-acetylase OafA/YrhL